MRRVRPLLPDGALAIALRDVHKKSPAEAGL
jgi:hypothetical protein